MSKTMSNPNDWSHFYNHNHHQNFPSSTAAAASGASTGHSLLSSSDATFATTTTTTASADASNNPIQFIGSSRNSSSTSSLNPEGGRVSKPARKRSRASRRTPTTLLNTDTSNFRAMVQQFTGGPVGPFGTSVGRGSSSSLNLPGFTYGLLNNNPPVPGRHQQLAAHQLIGNQISNAAMSTADGGGGGGFQHLQQYQPQFQSPSPFLFSLGNNNNSISDGGPTNSNTASDNPHLLLQPGEGSAGDQTGGAPPSGTNENRGSGFLY